MRMVKLGEVAQINPRAGKISSDQRISFVGMAQLDADTAVATPLEETTYDQRSQGYTVFKDRDILAAKITPCWENGKVGQAQLTTEYGTGSTEFVVIRPSVHLDARYLMHLLRQPHVRNTGTLRMTGSGGQRRVPIKYFSDLSIQLPELDEQRRIATILDKADAIHQKRRQALEHLNSLTQSIFHEIFGDHSGVRTLKLENVLTSISTGKSLTCESRPADDGEWGILKLSSVTTGEFDSTQSKAFIGDPKLILKHEVKPGDLLMTRKNTPDLVGALAIAESVQPKRTIPDLIFRLEVNETLANSKYLQALLMSPKYRHRVRELAGGSAKSMSNISAARLKNLEVPIPDLGTQNLFAKRYDQINVLRGILRKEIDRHQLLKSALEASYISTH